MKIRIVAVPAGEAPIKVRKEWLGLEMEVDVYMTAALRGASLVGSRSSGVVSGKQVNADNPNEGGYAIPVEVAIRALRSAGKEDAASYWTKANQQGRLVTHLIFGCQFCEVIGS